MIESIPMLKSSRVNYIFISDNFFFKRNGYFLKKRIEIVSMKWPVNIETCLQFPDYHKFWMHPVTYFILSLSNFRPTSKFCNTTRLFMQVYIIFYGLKFKLEMMNNILQMTKIITKCQERKRENVLCHFSQKNFLSYINIVLWVLQ